MATVIHTCYPLPDADIELFEGFFALAESDRWFTELLAHIAWEQGYIPCHGKLVPEPRLSAWYGDPGAHYTYSGVRHNPHPWNEVLLELKARIEPTAEVGFNSVLLNCYRDGRDSVGWHSDAERELGRNPVIASVSFGGTRRFLLRHKRLALRATIELTHGSLLLMRGATQHHWRHQVPKTRQPVNPRINLTFRRIHSVDAILG
ncbi:MAG: alpha-ketoglutarate-dependent dioxygenase AlkB [Gammaproteobacteria bacterium]|nr:alpha-ketoglutarate-dependent dioxygenase AlkB [Gammaproteobacteria bacterium]MCP5424351.1 alpha-ketoglutarate-dependent dioxygenase AlkB [Gammaproteobacteria bacterium]MCP5459102.1 alpha-ketoglutarate-dependent dioxygenase AlkB [Gammaproteobacteria bacterium]